MRNSNRRLAAFLVAALLAGCSSTTDPTGPRHRNIDLARGAWLAFHAPSYTFEVEMAGSWFPKSYYRVRVENGTVVSATNAMGASVANFTITIDTLWDRLLRARARGELNSALFDFAGVPVEADMGPWAYDGGEHYSVRGFTIAR